MSATPVTAAHELTGRVEAVDAVELRARVSGYVMKIHVRDGAEVRAGDVLFTIDPRPYRAALARASADVARARARVALARLESKRSEQLLAAGAIPGAERDTSLSTVTQAEAEVAAATAAQQLAQLDLEFTQVRAPISGRVGQALVSRGDFVAAGPAPTLLATLISVDPVHIYVTGDEQTFLKHAGAANGTAAKIGLADDPGYPYEGIVDFVDPRLDPSTGSFRLRISVPNPARKLVPGLYARVRLPEAAAVKTILVDDRAVLTDQDRKYVFVVGANDVADRRDVKLGRIVDGKRAVLEGLRDGDRVVTSGVQKVFPGAKVQAGTP